jgi:hypothetical protein
MEMPCHHNQSNTSESGHAMSSHLIKQLVGMDMPDHHTCNQTINNNGCAMSSNLVTQLDKWTCHIVKLSHNEHAMSLQSITQLVKMDMMHCHI